ncbi:MAG: hypothetical protein CL912_28190 [Deltaproteobacteria bacterium]|nr:hypothetical protein [Deltaproteobacteria bacterium]
MYCMLTYYHLGAAFGWSQLKLTLTTLFPAGLLLLEWLSAECLSYSTSEPPVFLGANHKFHVNSRVHFTHILPPAQEPSVPSFPFQPGARFQISIALSALWIRSVQLRQFGSALDVNVREEARFG